MMVGFCPSSEHLKKNHLKKNHLKRKRMKTKMKRITSSDDTDVLEHTNDERIPSI
jgi:hypothetical protein